MPDIKKYLSKEGLENYNELLPHSATQMQEYVSDWLDEHPEATTTVQDGAITNSKLADNSVSTRTIQNDSVTEPKLADKSVSQRTLSDALATLIDSFKLTGNTAGEILLANDSNYAAPTSLTIEGKSTQNGTPTPNTPAEIVSLGQIELHFASKNLLPIAASETKNGITFTTNEDGGTTITGTASATADHYYLGTATQYEPVPAGDLTLYGCTQGAVNTYQMYMVVQHVDGTTTIYTQATRPVTINAVDGDSVRVFVRVQQNATVNGTIYQQLEVGATATAYQPYSSASVLIPLTQAIRSLPNSTKDTLALSYLRPSTRDGWAWYSAKVTRNIAEMVLDGTNTVTRNAGTEIEDGSYRFNVSYLTVSPVTTWSSTTEPVSAYCNRLRAAATASLYNGSTDAFGMYQNSFYIRVAGVATVTEMIAWLTANPITVIYPISPTTTQLDPIELPFTAPENFTIWNEPSTGLQIEYIRNNNLVIQHIEEAIADK